MNRLLIAVYVFTTIIGCKHNEEITVSPFQTVFAGKLSSDMKYIDFVPDLALDTLTINPNQVRLNLNQDVKEDIVIDVSGGNNSAGITFFSLSTQANKIGFSCSEVNFIFVSGGTTRNCIGKVTAIDYGKIINNNACKWSVTDSVDQENFILINRNYTYKYYNDLDTLNWKPIPNQYIGFRFIENNDTLYGWMRVSIVGKAHIVIHDLAYQKR